MLRLTFIADNTLPADGIVLCESSRSLAELEVKFNHRRQISVDNLCTALGSGAAALAQDFSNHRNTLALKVRRDVDLADDPFDDYEAAFLFTLDQPALFLGIGVLQIELVGVVTNETRYLLNCGVEAISLADNLGVAPAYEYTFNGGLITATSPF